MRLSTGIILSILSTNVFAIEHRNGAHPSSLLARRAVVADTDGPFLQKRSGDEDQEEQKDQKKQKKQKEQKDQKDQKKRDKSNKYHPFTSGQANCVYVKGNFGEDLYPTPNYNDDTGESNTYSPTYDSNQDRGATGGREDVHTDVDPDQEESSFTDASQGSSFQVLGHIRKGLSHVKHRPGLVHRLNRALTTFKQVWRHIGGNGGRTIGWHIYSMFIHALYRSHEYKLLYKNSAESPFILKLPSSASDEQRRIYKSLQDEVHKSIKDHISAIMHAVDRIFTRPGSVVLELESIISSADRFYVFISNIRSEYSRLLSSLGMFGSKHLANVDYHMILLRVYRCNLSERLNIIKGFIKKYIKALKQEGSSKFSSSTLESMGLSEIGSKSSDDGAPSSTQSEDVASSSTQSNVAVVNNLVILANQ